MVVSEKLSFQLESSLVAIHAGRKVNRITGESEVRSVILDNGEEIETSGVFVELGAKGAIELVTALGVALDSESMRYVAANKNQETNVAGLYAAGDICGPPWQIAKAVGEGCVDGLEAAAHARRAGAKS
jgi:thioredoxin reductase (NADPH)